MGRSALALTWALTVGALLGALAALAAETLGLIGLYEIAIGLAGGFALVVAAQLLDLRARMLHLVLAGCLATASLASQVGVDAWLLYQGLVRDVTDNGLLLADDAIVRGDDDPAALVDDSLRVDTGAGGVRGAARLRLSGGLPVLRVGGQVRSLRMPSWLHALIRGALAAWIAVLCARALANWRAEPRCTRCGGALDRERALGVDDAEALAIAQHWAALDPRTLARDEAPPLPAPGFQDRGANAPVELVRERCPAPCAQVVGWELRRARSRGLRARSPGPIARLARSALELTEKSSLAQDDLALGPDRLTP